MKAVILFPPVGSTNPEVPVDLIDQDGRILGTVNVIDALVVLLVLAVLVAGVALVTRPAQDAGGPELANRYATLDLGTQPAYLADRITPGDTVEPAEHTNLTITEVYRTETSGSNHVYVRARLTAPVTAERFDYNGGPPRLGRTLSLATPLYEVSGDIVSISGTDPGLPLVEVPVLLEATVSAEEAARLERGARITTGSRTVATISEVLLYETDDPNHRRAIVHATLLAYRSGRTLQYGPTPLRIGETVHLTAPGYDIAGGILSVGIDRLPRAQTAALLRLRLPDTTAAAIEPGDTYRVGGQPIATVETVDAYGTETPGQTLVYVGVEYHTYHPRSRPQFAGQIVHEGAMLPFRTDRYEFVGEVVRLHALEHRGRQTTRQVTLDLEGVDPDLAQSLEAGMTERVHGNTIAEVRSVSVDPAQLVLTTDAGEVFLRDHPLERDVTITASLQVRETATGVSFKGSPIRRGDPIVLDLGTITVRATVRTL